MTTLIAAQAHEQGMDWNLLDGMFRLRDEIFQQRLGWQVMSHNGLERDSFDELKPVYLIAKGEGRKVRGCTRILPTTGAYMLKDTFPYIEIASIHPVLTMQIDKLPMTLCSVFLTVKKSRNGAMS